MTDRSAAPTKKLDRRAVRTRRALREALIALILEKGYESITVRDITDRADLNRGTLYLHYRDKQDLLLSSGRDVCDELLGQLAPISARNLRLDVPERHLTIVFQHVAANVSFYRVMFGEHGVPAFVAQIRRIVSQAGLSRLKTLRRFVKGKPFSLELVAGFSGGAIIGVIEWWLEHDLPLPPDVMARHTVALTVNGVYPTLGLDRLPLETAKPKGS